MRKRALTTSTISILSSVWSSLTFFIKSLYSIWKYLQKYLVKTLSIDVLSLEFKKRAPQRLITQFIIKPRINGPYLMRIKSTDVVDPHMILKLLSWFSTLLEEVWSEPYLLQMSLVRILGQYLLDGYFSFGRSMNSKPNNAEASSS